MKKLSLKNYEAAIEIYVSLQKLNDAVETLEQELMRLTDCNPNGHVMEKSRTGMMTLIQALKADGIEFDRGEKNAKKA